VDGSGFIYYITFLAALQGGTELLKLYPNGTVLWTYPSVSNARAVTVDSSSQDIYVLNGNAVTCLFQNGTQKTVLTTSNPSLWIPFGIAVSAGNVFVADTMNSRIVHFFPDGSFEILYTSLSYPTGVVVGLSDDLFILDSAENLIVHIDVDGTLLTVFPFIDSLLSYPEGPVYPSLAIDQLGDLYVADQIYSQPCVFFVFFVNNSITLVFISCIVIQFVITFAIFIDALLRVIFDFLAFAPPNCV
jgi:DNA-binding beta-propeller fold protein YncE